MIEGALALLMGVATLALAVAAWRLERALRVARGLLFRAQIVESEAARLDRAERQLAEAQRLTENVVCGGTQTVRAIHQGIAAIPFGILEAIPVTRDTTRVVRAAHDLIAGAVYGGIGAVNRGVGAGLRAGLKAGRADSAKPEAHENAGEAGPGQGTGPGALK